MVIMTETIGEENYTKKRFKRKHVTIQTFSDNEEQQCIKAITVESESEHDENIDDIEPTNAGWVDSISKILKSNKPKKKKSVVLSKAKKLTDPAKPQARPVGFQVETTDGEIKEEKIEVSSESEVKHIKRKRRELPKLRVKPNILEKDRERTLQKVATKGVVQLFNAVRMQQKDVSRKLEEAGPLEVRKEKVLRSIDKRAFLDVLMGEKSQSVDQQIATTKNEDRTVSQDSTWNVLKEDFMMGGKLKDWDKELEEENVEEIEQEIESESE